jgi:hypothetical protein
MKRSFFLLSFLFPLALSACAASTGIPSTVTPPQPEVDCPDPSGRSKLVEGSTFRDLSASLAEPLNGWQQCYDGLTISQSSSVSTLR